MFINAAPEVNQSVSFYSGSANGVRYGIVLSVGRTNAVVGYTFANGRPTTKSINFDKLTYGPMRDDKAAARFNYQLNTYAIEQAKQWIKDGRLSNYTAARMRVIKKGLQWLKPEELG